MDNTKESGVKEVVCDTGRPLEEIRTYSHTETMRKLDELIALSKAQNDLMDRAIEGLKRIADRIRA